MTWVKEVRWLQQVRHVGNLVKPKCIFGATGCWIFGLYEKIHPPIRMSYFHRVNI